MLLLQGSLSFVKRNHKHGRCAWFLSLPAFSTACLDKSNVFHKSVTWWFDTNHIDHQPGIFISGSNYRCFLHEVEPEEPGQTGALILDQSFLVQILVTKLGGRKLWYVILALSLNYNRTLNCFYSPSPIFSHYLLAMRRWIVTIKSCFLIHRRQNAYCFGTLNAAATTFSISPFEQRI